MRYSTYSLYMGSSTQFLHNLSSFLYTASSVCIRRQSFKLMLVRCRCGSSRPLATPRCPGERAHSWGKSNRGEAACATSPRKLFSGAALACGAGSCVDGYSLSVLNCDGASEQWRSRKRLRPQRAGIPCQSRMPHRQSLLERSSLPACQRSFRCRKACR